MKYSEAINEALHQIMDSCSDALLIGQGVTSPWYVGNTTTGLDSTRVIDTPTSENAVTGITLGASLVGLHPILCFPRMDFMHCAMDQIANHLCNWQWLYHEETPLTIWAIINRGGEQGAQHSQALHAIFTHLPNLQVVAPSTPHDVKGLFMASMETKQPTIIIDDRWLYNIEGNVSDEIVPIGKGVIRQDGSDVTVASSSYLVHECLKASKRLDDISVEVIDLRSLKPLDKTLLFRSVKKTGKLVVVDGGWKTCGFSAEVSAQVSEHCFSYLQAPIHRVALPDSPAPTSTQLERQYYRTADNIAQSVKIVMEEANLQSSLRELSVTLPNVLD